jgi:Domain of unknown function (DUF5666)
LFRLSAAVFALSLTIFVNNANANACNAGVGGTGVQQDGVGGTGIINKGIGGTGITNNDAPSKGIGGTGNRADASGVGGTGITNKDTPNKGIGGTGDLANGVGGTGIVGVITGFASVCVNGIEVQFDNATAVDVDGLASSINALEVGQLVAIDSNNDGKSLKASRISVSHLLVGKVEKIDTANQSFQIMGQTINLIAADSKGLKINQLHNNQAIKLSGIVASNGQIYVSRIDATANNKPASVSGVLDSAGKINGVKVANAKNISAGSMVNVTGEWKGAVFEIKQIKENVVQRVLRGNIDVVMQGVIPKPSTDMRLARYPVATNENTVIKGDQSISNQSVIVRGKLDSAGKINAKSIEYSPRDKILERGGNPRPTASESKPTDVKPQNIEKDHSKNDMNTIEKVEVKNRPEKPDAVSKPETIEKPVKVEKPETIEKPVKTEKPETISRPEVIEKPTKIEKPETINKPETIEKPVKVEKPEAIEKPEVFSKPEIVEKPVKIERPIKIEKPEMIAKPEKIEKPSFEKPETPEISKR